jgi:hypothetical protein
MRKALNGRLKWQKKQISIICIKENNELTSKLFDSIMSKILASEESAKHPCSDCNTSLNLYPRWCIKASDGSTQE